jgi:hypothetical protein
MISINFDPSARELRRFGLAVLVGLAIIGGVLYFGYDSPVAAAWCVGVGLVVGAVGLTGHRVALVAYWPWMGLAFVLGNIMSRVLLSVTFLCVLTPIGLMMRLVGRDRLGLRKRPRESYWEECPPASSSDPLRQF